jgi:alkaline phosphatase
MARVTAWTRRDLLKTGAGAVAAMPLASNVSAPSARSAANARNIIFMVSDGMSPGVPALAEAFSWLVRGAGTHWAALSRESRVVHGQFDMASLDSIVTDSAAAASAWATGTRILNGAVNMLPDGRRLIPIGALAHERGRAIGLVTTTRITHATPAAFASAVPIRNLEDDIAVQYAGVVDVLLGGGKRHFDPAKRTDRSDEIARFRSLGYRLITTRDELLAGPLAGMVLGLFADSHVPYTIDRRREEAIARQCPTLEEMARAALAALADAPRGFLLQIEGGRVDHAAHNNDAPGMLWDQLAFDDAIGAVVEFQAAHPDTLVVITTDHGCGNPGVNGLGPRYDESSAHFENLALATASFDAMEAKLIEARGDNPAPSADDVRATLQWGTGLDIDPKHARVIADHLAGAPAPELNRLEANIYGLMAQALGNQTGVGWTGITHTSDWAPILALGPGSERFHGLQKSTDAFVHMSALTGIEHVNPSMTMEEARPFVNRGHERSPLGE